jgi:integrase
MDGLGLPEFAVEMLKRRKTGLAAANWRLPHARRTRTVMYRMIWRFHRRCGTFATEITFSMNGSVCVRRWPCLNDLTFHSFRKAVATILDDAVLSARVTADVLQHADPAMTQRKYMARSRVHLATSAALDRAVNG